MTKFKLILFIACLFCTSQLFAETDEERFQKEYDALSLKARKLTNKEIMKEIGFIYDINKNQSPIQTSFKIVPYVSEISARGKAGDVEAKFIDNSLWRKSVCENLVEQKMYSIGDTCTNVIENLKEVANSKVDKRYAAQSMEVLGDIYKKGVVTSKSDLLAAEWYYKAAKEYNSVGKRDEAVTSLEKSLNIISNYKPALTLQKSIIGF